VGYNATLYNCVTFTVLEFRRAGHGSGENYRDLETSGDFPMRTSAVLIHFPREEEIKLSVGVKLLIVEYILFLYCLLFLVFQKFSN
jgi:hypothetical protein